MSRKPLIIGLAILLFSCQRPKDDTKIEPERPMSDSIRLTFALEKALQIATKNISVDNYSNSFEIASDSGHTITTKITMGETFDTGKYLIVKRETPNYYIDVYLKKDNKFKKVITHEQWAMTYVGDTIQDINGDGKKDFLVNWYGASGCCLKNFIDVYLQLNDGTFSEMFEFVNPTFSASEQIIRGVTYGHPGESSLYKYKWNNLEIDTIEYIYHDFGENRHFTKLEYPSPDKITNKKQKIGLRLIPDEYRSIYGFDWFMNYRQD